MLFFVRFSALGDLSNFQETLKLLYPLILAMLTYFFHFKLPDKKLDYRKIKRISKKVEKHLSNLSSCIPTICTV